LFPEPTTRDRRGEGPQRAQTYQILFCGERQLLLARHKTSTTGLFLNGTGGAFSKGGFLVFQKRGILAHSEMPR